MVELENTGGSGMDVELFFFFFTDRVFLFFIFNACNFMYIVEQKECIT